MVTMMKKFDYRKLKKLRKKHKYTLSDVLYKLFEKAKVKSSTTTIHHWETDKTKPLPDHLYGLSQVYNVDMIDFFSEVKNEK